MSEMLNDASLTAWISSHRTHTGNIRKVNEDAVLDRAENGLWAVADGMGGHAAGDYASQLIVDALNDLALDRTLTDAVDAIEDSLLAANEQLHEHGVEKCGGATVGSTVAVTVIRGDVAVALWAGDSRVYRMREGSLEQVTRDHNPISDLLEVGAVSEAEALAADTNIVTRAVGGHGELHLDIVAFDVAPNDTLLLCSDGLYRELNQSALLECLNQDVEKAASDLLSRALAGVAHDNIALVVARPVPSAAL